MIFTFPSIPPSFKQFQMIFCKTFLAWAQFIKGIEMEFIFGFTFEEEKVL